MTTKKAAEKFDLKQNAIGAWIRKGKLKNHNRHKAVYLVCANELHDLLDNRNYSTWLSSVEVAKKLNYNGSSPYSYVSKLIQKGELEAVKVNGKNKINPESLVKYQNLRKNVSQNIINFVNNNALHTCPQAKVYQWLLDGVPVVSEFVTDLIKAQIKAHNESQ